MNSIYAPHLSTIAHTPANEFSPAEVEEGLAYAREICLDNERHALGGFGPQAHVYAIMRRREDSCDPSGSMVWIKAERSIISPYEEDAEWVGLGEEELKAWALSKLPLLGTFQPIGGAVVVSYKQDPDLEEEEPIPLLTTIVILVD